MVNQYVGSIQITERRAYCAIGRIGTPDAFLAHSGVPTVQIERIGVFALEGRKTREPRNPSMVSPTIGMLPNTPEGVVQGALGWLLKQVTREELKAVVIGCYGSFRSLIVGDEAYGTLANINVEADSPWRDSSICKIASTYLDREGCNTILRFQTDVNLAALGEGWTRGLRFARSHKPTTKRNRLVQERDFQESSLVYLKISQSVNGGITKGGEIFQGCHHSVMGASKPRRYRAGQYVDLFDGCCEIHKDCIEGLVNVDALEVRTGMVFSEITADNKVWDLVAYYVARLCAIATSILAPTRIILGGRIIEDVPAGVDMLNMTRYHFLQAISGARPGSPEFWQARARHFSVEHNRNPDYEAIGRFANFIQRRRHPAPGNYGGLILAERLVHKSARDELLDLTNTQS